jgi:dCTP deaminase
MQGTQKNIHLRTKGILPVQQLKFLKQAGIILSNEDEIEETQFQPNSIDLRLANKAYRVRSSFLPEAETVSEKLQALAQYEIPIHEGAILEPNAVYIIPLQEELRLPDRVSSQRLLFNNAKDKDEGDSQIISDEPLSAKANPKSSTGRLDIFTRVITDYSHRFDEISPGYQGKLYLEVVPKSFPIKVQAGRQLNQLRILHGHSFLSDHDILRLHSTDPILFDGTTGAALSPDSLKVNNGLFLSVNLQAGEDGLVGYKARKHRDIIELNKRDYYPVEDFWEPVYNRPGKPLILEPEAFYIFASKERCRIPPQIAAEMIAYDTGSGELRTHYAGFFDSGFGGSPDDRGARAVLEVRSHDVPFLIEDGQTFCRMVFQYNTEIPAFTYGAAINSNYQGQGLKLSKQFKQE